MIIDTGLILEELYVDEEEFSNLYDYVDDNDFKEAMKIVHVFINKAKDRVNQYSNASQGNSIDKNPDGEYEFVSIARNYKEEPEITFKTVHNEYWISNHRMPYWYMSLSDWEFIEHMEIRREKYENIYKKRSD